MRHIGIIPIEIMSIIEASQRGYTNIVRGLLARGVEINTQDNGGNTALIRASISGYALIIQLLLDHGADPNIQNKHGRTAYMYTKNEKVREILRVPIGRSMFQSKDRSREYMSDLYYDISFL